MKEVAEQTIGARIAQLRQERRWTQEALAERIAISRVAVSHIEMNLSTPGERTIALIAGLFKLTPMELVSGTSYPRAKAERLPPVVCCHTELELQLALLQKDLEWLQRLAQSPHWPQLAQEVQQRWLPHFKTWRRACLDAHEREKVAQARHTLLVACRLPAGNR